MIEETNLQPFKIAAMSLLGFIVRMDPGKNKTAICSALHGGDQMLAALKAIADASSRRQLPITVEINDLATAAIAKAEGRE